MDPQEFLLVYERYPDPCDDARAFRRPILPPDSDIVPQVVGGRIGFHWIPEDGVIWLYINGRRAGLFLSGIQGYEVYPAATLETVPNAARVSFNLPVPQ